MSKRGTVPVMFARPKLLLVSFEAVLSSFRLSLDQLQGPTLGLLSWRPD